MNNNLKEVKHKNEREICHSISSTLFYGPRFCLAKLNLTPISAGGDEFFLSGHGHILEFYSMNNLASKRPIYSIDVFPDSKSNVHGVYAFFETKALFCYGENECVILISNDGFNNNQEGHKEITLKKFKFNHWISAAKILSNNKVLLHFATNSLKLFNFEELFNEFETKGHLSVNFSNFEEKSIQLESRTIIASSLLQGETWETLQIFAGTSLGQIHLFCPALYGTKIVRFFHGNNGMPFAMCSHQNSLFSVGDDRSLRVWSIENGEQICVKFGHGARIFALELLREQKLIFTAGMDEFVCIWQWTKFSNCELGNVDLVKKVNICSGAFGTIRAIQSNYCNGNINLILASERGGLANISSFLQIDDCPIKPLFPVLKVNAFVFANLIGKQKNEFLLYLIDECRHLSICKLSNNFDEFSYLSQLSSKINGKLLFDGGQFRPNLFVFSKTLETLAICTQKAMFTIKIFPIGDSFDFNFLKFDGEYSQLIWLNPSHFNCLLAVKTNGETIIFDFSPSSGTSNKFLHFRQFTQFQLLSKNSPTKFPHIQSTLLIQMEVDEEIVAPISILFLGTRSGTILAYSICEGIAHCISIFRDAHGPNTVTSFHEVNSKFVDGEFVIGEFHTMGRDGTLRRWEWRHRIGHNELDLTLCSIRRLNFEWPSSFVQNCGRRLIAGFQSDDFVLFDEETNSILCRRRCGGGNRNWQLFPSNSDKYHFAFTQNSQLHLESLNPMQIDLIKPPIHSENIVALAFLPTQNGLPIILTGSLDRRISSFSFNMENENCREIIQKCSVQMHRSSIEAICLVKEKNLILTGGGRSELFCWKMDENANLDFLFSAKIGNADCRLTSICSINSHFSIVLCSDGTIRLIQLLANSISECHHFSIPTLAMFSTIHLAPESVDNYFELNSLLFAISTDGHLHTFRIETKQMKIIPLHPPFIVERCGLSSLCVQSPHENNHFIFIGSESGKLSACQYSNGNLELLDTANWHASTITAVHSIDLSPQFLAIFTIALDCRLCFGQFNLQTNLLNFDRQISLGISDPAALLIFPNENLIKEGKTLTNDKQAPFSCIVSGAGLECISFLDNSLR